MGKNTRGSKYPVVFHASTSGDEVPATLNHHVAAAEMGAGKGAGVPSSSISAPRAAWWGRSLPFRGARVQAIAAGLKFFPNPGGVTSISPEYFIKRHAKASYTALIVIGILPVN